MEYKLILITTEKQDADTTIMRGLVSELDMRQTIAKHNIALIVICHGC